MGHVPPASSTEVGDALLHELRRAAAGGRAVFVEARDRKALSALVRAFAGNARAITGLAVTVGDAADPDAPAWRQIALRLTAGHRAKAVARSSIASWAGVVPLIGPVLSAILDTIAEIRGSDRSSAPRTGSSIEDVRSLLTYGADRHRLIVVENLDAGDGSELSGAAFLIRELANTRTLLVATFESPGGPVQDLCREAERLGVGRLLVLATSDEGMLDDTSRRLLAIAAALGPRFSTLDLATASGLPHEEVEYIAARLSGLRALRLADTIESDGELVDIYEIV